MAKAHFILILTLAAFRLFAQPSLPTTNRTFVPMANPYSGSWIYYTTDSVSGLGYLNGASISYVTTASNGVVTYVNTATNGFVKATITNGLATTNFVLSQNYVTATVTNGLATVAYVNTATNGFVTAAITNGLATTNFVLSQNYVTASVTNGLATVAYVNSSTNGFVTAAITNGLATTNYVNTATNYVLTNDLGQLNSASNVLAGKIVAATNGLVTASVTNGLATVAYVNSSTNGFVTAAITNGLATTNYVRTATNGFVTATVTNGLATISYVNTATNYVLTNDLAQLNSASNALAGKIVAATNGFGSIVTHSASELRAVTIWSGTSGDKTLAKSKSFFAPPNNSETIAAQAYASGGTSVPATRSITLTNLYVVISGAINVNSSTLTILTNGVATPISVSFSLLQTTGNDTTDSVTVPAGTEIGIEITTGTGTVAMWSWSFEGW